VVVEFKYDMIVEFSLPLGILQSTMSSFPSRDSFIALYPHHSTHAFHCVATGLAACAQLSLTLRDKSHAWPASRHSCRSHRAVTLASVSV
jgi:hypothetical protein